MANSICSANFSLTLQTEIISVDTSGFIRQELILNANVHTNVILCLFEYCLKFASVYPAKYYIKHTVIMRCRFSLAEVWFYIAEYKYLSWVYGVDRKICHEGH